MPRRRESIIDLFLVMPWWACFFVAAVSYGLLIYLVPSLQPDTDVSLHATRIGRFIAGTFVLLGIGSVLRTFTIARRFERHRRANSVQDLYHPHPEAEPTNWGDRSNTTFGLNEGAPQCPTCGKSMVLRAARRGAKAGAQFWGCSGFPKCQGMREV